MERKGSTGSAISILSTGSSSLARRESETLEEWEKRKTRWEKKEKAKADEARRLRVIVSARVPLAAQPSFSDYFFLAVCTISTTRTKIESRCCWP